MSTMLYTGAAGERKHGRRAARRACGFTMLELMIVVLILAIVTSLGIDGIATFEANQRAERASREALILFRYARTLAFTTGKNAKVQVDPAAKTLAVYWMSNGVAWDATPVAVSFTSGGSMILNLATAAELRGTSFTVTPVGTTSFAYNAAGTCGTTGSLTFTFGSKRKILTVVAVGEPQVN